MKIFFFIAITCFLFSFETPRPDSKHLVIPEEKGLFDSDEILTITLQGNVKELMNDRDENPTNHPVVIIYTKADSSQVSTPVEIKTRGHFRKQKGNCQYPPLSIQFPKNRPSSSIFNGQAKLKLVMPCAGDE